MSSEVVYDHVNQTGTTKAKCLSGCRGAVEKKNVLENLDLVLLAMDEICDKGWVYHCLPRVNKVLWAPKFLMIANVECLEDERKS